MDNKKRYAFLYVVLIVFAIIAIIRLSVLQIVNGKENYEKSLSRTQRTVSVSAPRGEIYDRYGRVIVGNRMGFSVEFQRVKGMDDEEIELVMRNIKDKELMMVTPKEIDNVIDRAAALVAMGINSALQPDISPEDILAIVS